MPTSGWNADEDNLMLDAINRLRDKRDRPMWKLIADEMSTEGRNYTQAQCRNRYSRMQAAPDPTTLVEDAGGRPPNKCTYCGMIKKGHSCRGRVDLDVVGQKRERDDTLWLEDIIIGETLCWPIEELISAVEEQMLCEPVT